MHPSRPLAAYPAAILLAATMPQLAQARELVGFSDAYSSGTVVVKTSERALYYVLGNGQAVRYPVGVGRAGKQWTGTAMINGKQLSPAWSPPEGVKRDKSSLPNVIPAERLLGLLTAGKRLRPEGQPRELFADNPQLVLRAGFVEPVDQPDQRADMLLGQLKETVGGLGRHRTSSGRMATLDHDQPSPAY